MKKISLLLILSIICGMLASCSFLDGTSGGSTDTPNDQPTDTPSDTPDDTPPPEPILRGDSALIIGADTCFTLVYKNGEDSRSGRCATDIRALAKKLGLKQPEKIADTNKKETKCEFLIGETNRALSALAKAEVDEKIEADPRGLYWVWLYSDGQLALYANNRDAYVEAVAELEAKFYKDGEITVKTDLGEIGSVPGPHEAYMSYEVFDNFYDGYTDPFGMTDDDYKKMTITRETANRFRISYTDEQGGKFSAAFVKKDWGMWAMGGMSYTTAEGVTHSMTSSSTDYEYVFRVGADTPTSFRSGNHGDYPGDKNWAYYVDDTSKSNDRLLDMTFYDGKSGEKFELAVGETKVLDGIRIVMHHNIYEKNYTRDNVLINATRSYLYNGYDIMLDTKLYMTQDVKFGNSYSCMLPVLKEYGNCAMFYAIDGSTVFMHTPDKADMSLPEMSMGVIADYIDIWGENNSAYHIKIKLNNIEDQLRNSVENSEEAGYVGIRNMPGSNGLGSTTNKIYCSCFSAEGEMAQGESLHFNTGWSFSYEPDFVNPDREPDRTVGYD